VNILEQAIYRRQLNYALKSVVLMTYNVGYYHLFW